MGEQRAENDAQAVREAQAKALRDAAAAAPDELGSRPTASALTRWLTARAERISPSETDEVRVGFRYRDGEVLSPEREAQSEDIEIPVAVIDLGDGEWLTLTELRAMHAERLEQSDDAACPPEPCCPGAGSMAHVRGCVNHPEADHA